MPAVEHGILPRIGAQFFINPDDTPLDTRKHFELMRQHGIRLVRLFVLWEHVEPRPGIWDFQRYDAVYDLAEEFGIRIVSTLTAEDPPQWYEDKPFYHHYANLNEPTLKAAASRYIAETVRRYCRHPAHYAWILMNEPEVFVNQQPSTMLEFQLWLEAKYGSIQALNAKWYRKYDSFRDISIHPENQREYWQCFAAFVDWTNFVKSNLLEQLEWIRSQVRAIDATSPLHLNPKGFFGNLAPVGQDYWKENQVSDILGASIHPAWKFLWFGREDYGMAFAFCVDLIRSASNGKSFWVTELQSGATLMTGMQPCTPTPQELTAWLLDAVGAGAKAVVYWMWHPRTFGQEAGEWGIVTANHRVSKRLLASAEVSRLLEENQEIFSAAEPEQPRIAIFYNHATEILSLIEGSELYRTPEAPIQSLVGVYKALAERQLPVDFINEEQILNGELSKYEVLYLPYSYALDLPLQKAIADYTGQGGIVWAEAPCAWKNEYGEILREQPLAEVFGFSVNEFCGCSIEGHENSPYLCQADLELEGAEVLSHFTDSSPSILCHKYGGGQAFFVNSTPSLGYFHTQDASFAEQISFLAAKATQPEIRIETKGKLLRRTLHSGAYRILILENWGAQSADCTVVSRDSLTRVKNLLTREEVTIQAGQLALTLQPHETQILLLKPGE